MSNRGIVKQILNTRLLHLVSGRLQAGNEHNVALRVLVYNVSESLDRCNKTAEDKLHYKRTVNKVSGFCGESIITRDITKRKTRYVLRQYDSLLVPKRS